jgi:hypothetical protein
VYESEVVVAYSFQGDGDDYCKQETSIGQRTDDFRTLPSE